MGITEILIKQAREEAFKEAQELMLKERADMLKERKTAIHNMRKIGFSAEKIADILECPHAEVVAIFAELNDVKQG